MAREFKGLSSVLRTYSGLIATRIAENLRAENKIASGTLEESIEARIKTNGFNILMVDYWEAVDKGRKAGKFPPISKIEEWLKSPNVRDRLRFGATDRAFGDKERKQLAFLISRKIARQGTKGSNFFTNVVESDIIDDMVEALTVALSDDILESLDLAE